MEREEEKNIRREKGWREREGKRYGERLGKTWRQ